MSLHRFFAPAAECEANVIRLSGPEAHHAADVLRLGCGAEATVLNGEGGKLFCRVTHASRKEVVLNVVERTQEPPPSCRITLYQAIPKGKILEDIIEKATELGVSRVVPVLTDRVVARPADADFSKKQLKWQATAIEAAKQCGQAWLPEIDCPRHLSEVLAEPRMELEVVGALTGETRPLSTWIDQFQSEQRRKPAVLGAWIGPEGDFTPDELDAIIAAGARPISLGSLVLRCETAALYTISILRYEVGR